MNGEKTEQQKFPYEKNKVIGSSLNYVKKRSDNIVPINVNQHYCIRFSTDVLLLVFLFHFLHEESIS